MKESATTIATAIIQLAAGSGFTLTIKDGTTLSVSKRFTPGSLAEFAACDMDAPHILALLPTTSAGSVWGTDGGGVGAHGAAERGQFQLSKSGGSKRVLQAVAKLLAAATDPITQVTPNPITPQPSMKNTAPTPQQAPAATAAASQKAPLRKAAKTLPATPETSLVKVAVCKKDMRAALAARAGVLKTTVATMAPDHLNEELLALLNADEYRGRFLDDAEFTLHFRTCFKAELLRVGKSQNLSAEALAKVALLADETPEEVALAAQIQAQAVPAEVLAYPFYAVELREAAAVAVGFDEVDKARKYAKRRNLEQVLTQVATREQYADRLTPDAMLHRFNLLAKPYELGEYVEPQLRAASVTDTAPTLAAQQPQKATVKKEAVVAAPGAKKPAPARKPVAAPAEGAPAIVVLQAKLAGLVTIADYTAFVEEMKQAGCQLLLKSYARPVELLSHTESEVYEDVTCLSFAYPGEKKRVSKAYLHLLPKFYEVAPAAQVA